MQKFSFSTQPSHHNQWYIRACHVWLVAPRYLWSFSAIKSLAVVFRRDCSGITPPHLGKFRSLLLICPGDYKGEQVIPRSRVKCGQRRYFRRPSLPLWSNHAGLLESIFHQRDSNKKFVAITSRHEVSNEWGIVIWTLSR